jgi:hypothetical protein
VVIQVTPDYEVFPLSYYPHRELASICRVKRIRQSDAHREISSDPETPAAALLGKLQGVILLSARHLVRQTELFLSPLRNLLTNIDSRPL